ncbi:MAG: DUF4445 domain-containing protein [Deltaproteobacteria bacterium]|nr:DUF4445 domain-containing protein [Deltaproteobacteria bacterium]
MRRHEVVFQPSRVAARVESGATIAEAARTAGVPLEAPCAGAGACGKCVVQIRRGSHLETALACLARVESDLEVILPSLEMTPVQTVEAFLGAAQAPRWEGTGAEWGMALDLGTTTLVAALVNLATGRIAGRSSTLCPLVACGHDVVSRIRHARSHPRALRRMQRDLVCAVNMLSRRLGAEAGIETAAISRVVAAGNTTMQHVFLGLPVAGLGEYPYRVATLEACTMEASEVGLDVGPGALVTTFPAMSAWVGGDIVAGLVAIGADTIERPALFLDVGTNGEMVLLANGELIAASTAAGPCFEGMSIHSGMRAAEGAIQHVRIADDLVLDVVGGGSPRGLCGSGLLDLVAELRRAEIVSSRGRLAAPGSATGPAALASRLFEEDGRRRMRLDGDVLVTQGDIRQVQLAKAAIRAGVDVLAGEAAMQSAELRTVFVAGAFGTHARESSILGVGLLPDDARGKLAFVGNASLEGATRALRAKSLLDEAARIARTARVVDLAPTEAFPRAFRDAMSL